MWSWWRWCRWCRWAVATLAIQATPSGFILPKRELRGSDSGAQYSILKVMLDVHHVRFPLAHRFLKLKYGRLTTRTLLDGQKPQQSRTWIFQRGPLKTD